MHTNTHNPVQRSKNGNGQRRNHWRLAIWGAAALLLMLPLVAMQFTNEVNWDETDFIVMGAMLFAACGAYELGAWMSGNTVYRAAFGVAVLGAFLLVWVNLAVGIIGSENNPANLMYFGVLAIAIIGAVAARFRPNGMARALVATAVAHVLVAVIALISDWSMPPHARFEILGVTAFFLVPWLVSATLFWKAAHSQMLKRDGDA